MAIKINLADIIGLKFGSVSIVNVRHGIILKWGTTTTPPPGDCVPTAADTPHQVCYLDETHTYGGSSSGTWDYNISGGTVLYYVHDIATYNAFYGQSLTAPQWCTTNGALATGVSCGACGTTTTTPAPTTTTPPPGCPDATGGIIAHHNGYTTHTFTEDGTFTPPECLTDVEVLIVGGGGGGAAGGGGAGGVGYISSVAVSGPVAVFVGAGGTAGHGYPGTPLPTAGSPSSFGDNESGGGGYGGTRGSPSDTVAGAGGTATGGGSPGNGGGGYYSDTAWTTGGAAGGAGAYAGGGNGNYKGNPYPSGGGGGAGGAGGDATANDTGGVGGQGVTTSFSGALKTYGRGGKGVTYFSADAAINGGANTGNGGSGIGGQNSGATAGAGGSGIVIVRYPMTISTTTTTPPPCEPVNYALATNGSTATATSTYLEYYPAKAINGDVTGWFDGAWQGWHSVGYVGLPQDFIVNFNDIREIDEIDMFTIQDEYQTPSTPTLEMTFSLYGITAYTISYDSTGPTIGFRLFLSLATIKFGASIHFLLSWPTRLGYM